MQKEVEIEGVELSKGQNENLSKVLKENPPDFDRDIKPFFNFIFISSQCHQMKVLNERIQNGLI